MTLSWNLFTSLVPKLHPCCYTLHFLLCSEVSIMQLLFLSIQLHLFQDKYVSLSLVSEIKNKYLDFFLKKIINYFYSPYFSFNSENCSVIFTKCEILKNKDCIFSVSRSCPPVNMSIGIIQIMMVIIKDK